jgi:tetratricopeptide (TPR) repeat protein
VLDDGRQLELDQIAGVAGRLRFVFERDRVSLRTSTELGRRGGEASTAGRLDEALALFRAAAAADPHDPQPRYEEGVTLLAMRRYAEAADAYAATEALAPGWFHCWDHRNRWANWPSGSRRRGRVQNVATEHRTSVLCGALRLGPDVDRRRARLRVAEQHGQRRHGQSLVRGHHGVRRSATMLGATASEAAP